MLTNDNLSLKTTLFLFVNKGFTKCEIWDTHDYIITHHNRRLIPHRIAAKKIEMLILYGVPEERAVKIVSSGGKEKLTKENLALLGKPIIIGTVEELSNDTRLWNKTVVDVKFLGFRRTKLIILVKDEYSEKPLTEGDEIKYEK